MKGERVLKMLSSFINVSTSKWTSLEAQTQTGARSKKKVIFFTTQFFHVVKQNIFFRYYFGTTAHLNQFPYKFSADSGNKCEFEESFHITRS